MNTAGEFCTTMFAKRQPPGRLVINGFGRIGRLVCRVAMARDDLDIVQINESGGDMPINAHLLQFDSVYGPWASRVVSDGDSIVIDGKRIEFTQFEDPASLSPPKGGADLVIECSGKFKTAALLEDYLKSGFAAVAVAAPMKSGGVHIVLGVNEDSSDFESIPIASAASGATQCLGVALKVVQDSFGIVRGSFTAIQNVTQSQGVVDHVQKDPRKARAAGLSLIPATARAATVIPDVIPELKGRLNGSSVRIPFQGGSLMECTLEISRPASDDDVNTAFRAAGGGDLAGLLRVEERPLVSVDYRGETHSCVVDALGTTVVDNTHLKLSLWYDNEMAFAHRVVEMASKMWAAKSAS